MPAVGDLKNFLITILVYQTYGFQHGFCDNRNHGPHEKTYEQIFRNGTHQSLTHLLDDSKIQNKVHHTYIVQMKYYYPSVFCPLHTSKGPDTLSSLDLIFCSNHHFCGAIQNPAQFTDWAVEDLARK